MCKLLVQLRYLLFHELRYGLKTREFITLVSDTARKCSFEFELKYY